MRSLTLFAALIFSAALCATSYAQEKVAGPFAYLANGEIHASCDTGDVIVTDAPFIESFAALGSTLAIVRRMENVTGSPDRLFVIDLKSRHVLSSERTVGAATVRFTCGSLILQHAPKPDGDFSPATTIDLATGRIFDSSLKNVGLSCSDGRDVIAYLMPDKQSNVNLVVRDVLTRKSTTVAKHADAVSVSPLGRFVAYRDGDRICRWKRSDQSTECVDSNAAGPWIEAIDDGQIWFGAAGGENCVYHLPGMKPVVDFCLDLYAWHAQGTPVLLRKKTEMIQSLQPESADLLCKQGLSPILITMESGKK